VWRDAERFLILTPALDGRDGVSEVSRQIARALVDHAGPDVVETWAYRGREPRASVPAHAFRAAAGRRTRMLGWTLQRAPHAHSDLTVVVTHVHLAPLAGLLAVRGAQRVVFIHGIEAWRPLRRRETLAMTGNVRVIANSRRTATLCRAANPSLPAPVVCPLGIGPGAAAIRWSAEPGFALIVGRISSSERYKGHDALIDAWPLVLDAVPGARLVVAGDGDDRSRLQALVEERRLSAAIRFTGAISDGELRGLYQACAAYVMPSSGEGFGLAYLEAMRDAKPCVALRVAGEIVEDGATGLLLDSTDAPVLADAMIRLFRDPAMRHRLGAAGAQRVRTMFEERHFARRFTDAIGLRPAPHRAAAVRTASAGA
jgi:phosphatidyl-myo-inositol dimannoside synthase